MMQLTKTEKAILAHRLEVPDAIAEATGLGRELVYVLCNRLLVGDYEACMAEHRKATRLILWDAVDGSTIGGCDYSAYRDGEISRQKYAAIIRCGTRLADKVNNYIGPMDMGKAVFRDC